MHVDHDVPLIIYCPYPQSHYYITGQPTCLLANHYTHTCKSPKALCPRTNMGPSQCVDCTDSYPQAPGYKLFAAVYRETEKMSVSSTKFRLVRCPIQNPDAEI